MFIFLAILFSALCIDCDVADPEKEDCGYVGIQEKECLDKGCCWKPKMNDIPWCYYPKGPSVDCFLNDNSTTDPPFTSDQVEKMKSYFLANIDVDGSGGVCASPSKSDPDYWYHWMRDGALSMNALMIISEMSEWKDKMKDYVTWVLEVQYVSDPYGDVRINPKFELADHSVFVGGWCRPQTDGPALRSLSLVNFANALLDAGEKDYVQNYLWTNDQGKYNGGAIKYDLDWVINSWGDSSCDLWEEVRSSDFFWNRIMFKKSLLTSAKFASRMGDETSAQKYRDVAKNVNDTLLGHWNGDYIEEDRNRKKDSAVIVGFNDGYCEEDGLFSPNSEFVTKTIKTLDELFCREYDINIKDTQKKIPGVLYGRYSGGNPWILLTAALAQVYYRAAKESLEPSFDHNLMKNWAHIADTSNIGLFANSLFTAGDSVLKRIAYHVKDAGYHLAEQLGKHDGKPLSAVDLTWSYAEVLKAMKYRGDVIEKMKKN